MRILLATDAWEPQVVNGLVRTLARIRRELTEMDDLVEVISPDQFPTFPLPTYPEIKLAVGAFEKVQQRFREFEPEAIHIATEGPIGLAARRICLEWKLPFTTSYHTRFPEYVSARLPLPLAAGYAYMKWFHKPSGRMMVATRTMATSSKQGFRNLSVWSRGVDTETFHPRRLDEPDLFEGLPRPIWLNVGRVAVEKNVEAFLELDLPGSKVVVGDGPLQEELREKFPAVRLRAGVALSLRRPRRPLRLRRRLRFPLAHRHLRPGDAGSVGLRPAGGRVPGPGTGRHHPRLRSRGPGPRPDPRPARGLPRGIGRSTRRRRARRPSAIPGGPAPRSSGACSSPIPSRRRAGSGGACGAWLACVGGRGPSSRRRVRPPPCRTGARPSGRRARRGR